ncbi:MAG: LptF/LptG family permease [Bacteriovoracaceae bacterium]|nr:LptF/LptG family permease [Bacteriovoracaceae bacterium]
MYSLTLLDKYFLKIWIRYFIFAFMALYGLVLLGDFVNNILRNKYHFQQILMLLAYNAPLMWSKIIPVCCCLATLFTLQNLTQNSELIIFLASGYSRVRMTCLLALIGVVIGLGQIFNLGFIAPKTHPFNAGNLERANDKNSSKQSLGNDRFWIKSLNYIGSYTFYDAKNKTMYNPEFFFYDEQFKLNSIFRSKYAYFLEKKANFSIWSLSKVEQFTELEKKDFPHQREMNALSIQLKEGPEELVNFQSDLYTLSLFRFYRFISSIKETGINLTDYYFYFYDKFAHSLFCIIFALFPWLITREYNQRHKGTGKTIFYGLLFSIGAFTIYIGQSKMLLAAGVPPFYASLLVPILWLVYSFHRSIRD